MDPSAFDRVRRSYEGAAGRRWLRIEQNRPETYLEHNVVIGRRRMRERLTDWLAEGSSARILDAGCGTGALAVELAAAGADVLGVDLVEAFVVEARRTPVTGKARFEVGNLVDAVEPGGGGPPFDAVVLTEVLEDYVEAERFEILRAVALSGVPRVVLAFRVAEDGGGWLWQRLGAGAAPVIDEIGLLRWIHLATPLRQRRHERVRVRNYRLVLSDLRREA